MALRGHPPEERGPSRGDPLSVLYAAKVHDRRVRNRLEESGCTVTTVRSQRAALAAVDDAEPDCVVAGPRIGDLDPVGLCAAIREHDADVPVLVCTDDGLGDRAAAAIEADVTRVLPTDDPEALAAAATDEGAAYRAERRERERLERDSRMLDALMTHLPLSIYFKDEQHRHERVSDAMICSEDPDLYIENDEGKAHQHPDDLLGKTDFDIFGPAAEEAIEDDRRVMETGDTILDKVERTHTRLGDEAFFSTTKAPRYDEDGNVIGVVGVTLDVTDRIRYRRDLEQQNERLEEFASMLSHDLRSPLSVAKGYLEVLESGHDPQAVEHSMDALDRMEELIDEILTFARQGQAVVDPDVVCLAQVARDAWNAVDTGDATLEVDVELPVRADPARLQRALENVFRNAIEHGSSVADDGSDAVTVRVADDGTDFYVEDDGPGIPAERRDEVFERGVSSSEDGTGFGLAAVQAIAEAHGWEVSVEEGSDGGARVVFSGVVRSAEH